MRKRKIYYIVSTRGMHEVWYDREYKKWDIVDWERDHKGYSSSKDCMTMTSAVRSARSIFKLGVSGKITVTRVYRKHGKRRFRDWTYNINLEKK